MNEIQSIKNQTNYSNPDSQQVKKTESLILIFFLSTIIIILLFCFFINGLTNEIQLLTEEIQHYLYHYYGCCQFHN